MFNYALVKSLRKEKRLNQSQLAELCGVHPVTVSNWERGQKQPEGNNLQALATALGVTTDYLMGREEIKKDAPDGQKTAEGVHIIASNNR
ncbi:MAG: helix-turn-helix transcriptional regulator, partial [Pyramidobacter sp.]|nr:helix-turn-helix transcriptional regulator [Pyramidobacter sp.]